MLYSAYLTMTGGSITNNTTNLSAGGVYVYSSSTMVMNGGEISYNTATNRRGGGGVVECAEGEDCSFTMSGGTIKNNQANNNSGISTGDNNNFMGNFTYKSGIICENTPTNEYETSSTCPN